MMLLFSTMTVWGVWLVYFWVSLLALCISPFLFNPHQFAWNDFFIDYREYLRWLSRGNTRSHSASWISFCRLSRTRITGYKRKALGDPSSKLSGDVPRAHFTTIFFSEVIGPLVLVAVTLIPYLFINAQVGVIQSNQAEDVTIEPTNALIRVAIVAFAPVAINAGVLLGFFGMACCMGPILSLCCKKFGAVLAAIAHAIAVIMLLAFFEVMFFLEAWSFSKALLGMIAVVSIQRFVYKLIIALALTREFKADTANIAWWTGKWYALGWHTISQPGREYLCKITELGYFAADFVLGHILLFLMLPVLLIPYIDKFHSVMLFWLRPRYVHRTLALFKTRSLQTMQPANPSSHLFTQANKASKATSHPLLNPLFPHAHTLHRAHRWPARRRPIRQRLQRPGQPCPTHWPQ
jgi:1,3-beta-glucan synthase